MVKRYIFGIGTGRCGSHAFATLLNIQKGFCVTHENRRLPWKIDLIQLGQSLEQIEQYNMKIVGDVGFWYLPYVNFIWGIHPNALFICLRRDKDQTVESFLRKVPKSNHWTMPDSAAWAKEDRVDPAWQNCFPKFNKSKKEALEKYWHSYYTMAEKLAEGNERLRIFDMESVLNTDKGQATLFEFLGIQGEDRIPQIGLKTNEGRHQ